MNQEDLIKELTLLIQKGSKKADTPVNTPTPPQFSAPPHFPTPAPTPAPHQNKDLIIKAVQDLINKQNEANKKIKDNESIIDKMKTALGLKQKEEPKKEDPNKILLKLIEGQKEEPKKEETKENSKEKEANYSKLLKVVEAQNKKIKELEDKNTEDATTKELIKLGLNTPDERMYFELLYEEATEDLPEGQELSSAKESELIKHAQELASTTKKFKERKENVHKRLKTENPLQPSIMTSADFNKLTLPEKQDLYERNPLLYQELQNKVMREQGFSWS